MTSVFWKITWKPVATVSALFSASSALAESATSALNEGPWWLAHALTVAGIFVAAATIVFQLGRQHRNEIRLQTENFKSQLKLQVYQEFSSCLSTAADKIGTASMYATTAALHAKMYMQQFKQGINPSPVEDRAMAFLDKNSSASNAAIEAVFLIEKYFIMHPELDIFRLAVSSALHDAGGAFHALFDFMLTYTPVDEPGTQGAKVVNVRQLSDNELDRFQALSAAYVDAAGDLDSYLSDMRTELQELLLIDLFPNRTPKRRPLDPSKKVISLNTATVKSLRTYFLKHTEWGRKSGQVHLEVLREFHGRL